MITYNSVILVYKKKESQICRRVGMADEADSKSVVGNYVRVQVPPPAVKTLEIYYRSQGFFAYQAYQALKLT